MVKYIGTNYCNKQWMHCREWIDTGKKSSSEHNVKKVKYISKIANWMKSKIINTCLTFAQLQISAILKVQYLIAFFWERTFNLGSYKKRKGVDFVHFQTESRK